MKLKLFLKYIIIVALLSVSASTLSHDTIHIHPRITLEIAKLIQAEDKKPSGVNAYKEIYELHPNPIVDPNLPVDIQFFYWGADFDPRGIANTIEPLPEYLGDDQTEQYLNGLLSGYSPIAMNVITGVVYEDNPATKVLHHFYHGGEAEPLTVAGIDPGDTSDLRAMDFYNQSIEKMGHYGEASKQEAFFLFGQALHHVEDMTSPAHIHNDAHLTFDILGLNFDAGKDDYEGWWLPQQKIDGSEVDIDATLASATAITPVTNPWQDIWSTSGTNLVQTIFNGSTFNASLDYTFSMFDEDEDDGSYSYSTYAGVVPDASGEMAEMFPCPQPAATPDICLHWSEDAPDAPAHWVINNVGGFQHQFFIGANDAWWPIEADVDTSIIGQKPAPFSKNKYYIEELASDNSASNPVGNVLKPTKMRSSLYASWTDNMQANSASILEKYASTFLPTAVSYGAGFTQNWYDIANTPPYLKTVTAKQAPAGGGAEQTTYYALWTWGDNSTVNDVEERKMARQINDISHIHSKQDLTLELKFNEPIKQITVLRIGNHNAAGACTETDNRCLDIIAKGVVGAKTNNDTVWTYTIPKAEIDVLNGKLQLIVKAEDKNRHFDGIGFSEGAELDETPETPARRNITFANDTRESGNPEFRYPWYQKGDLDETPQDIAYSYDFENGDQNHVLVFDTKAPAPTITIDLTL